MVQLKTWCAFDYPFFYHKYIHIQPVFLEKSSLLDFFPSTSFLTSLMMTSNNHVQYILLAEFDIDKGASLKYQYPHSTGTDEG